VNSENSDDEFAGHSLPRISDTSSHPDVNTANECVRNQEQMSAYIKCLRDCVISGAPRSVPDAVQLPEFLQYLLSELEVGSMGMGLVAMHNKLNKMLFAEMLAGRRSVLTE
jgi:hypothetical protein